MENDEIRIWSSRFCPFLAELESDEINEERIERYMDRFFDIPIEKRIEILHKISMKYEGNWKKYEKADNIYEFIEKYATKYGQPLISDDECIEKYVIEEKFIVKIVCGQGECRCHIKECGDDEIFVKYIKDDIVDVYRPNGELLVSTDNILIFNEILVQINKKSINGYYIVFHGKRYEIDKFGDIANCPGLFGQIDRQMKILMGF